MLIDEPQTHQPLLHYSGLYSLYQAFTLPRAECSSKTTLALRRPQAEVRPGQWRL